MHSRFTSYEGSLKRLETINFYLPSLLYLLQKGIRFHQQECHVLSFASLSQCNPCTLQQLQECCQVDGNTSSNPFQVTTSILTRGVLAPFLFIILIDYLMTKAIEDTDSGVVTHPRQSRRQTLIQTLNKRPGFCGWHCFAGFIYSLFTGSIY